MSDMPFADLEVAYETLAEAIDRAGGDEALFLTKLVMLLAQSGGDLTHFQEAVAIAEQDLPSGGKSEV